MIFLSRASSANFARASSSEFYTSLKKKSKPLLLNRAPVSPPSNSSVFFFLKLFARERTEFRDFCVNKSPPSYDSGLHQESLSHFTLISQLRNSFARKTRSGQPRAITTPYGNRSNYVIVIQPNTLS